MAMSWRTASYFSSRPTAATNSSQLLTAIPGTPRHASVRAHSQRHTQARAQAQTRGSFPRRFLAFLFENLCTAPLVCRRPRALPASRTFGGLAPAAKYTYIDAFNGKTVTRETLLRYTFKSRLVNVLIPGFLGETCRPGLILQTLLEGGWGGFGAFTWGCSPRHRGLFLRPRRAKASLGRGHVLLDDSRLRCDRIPIRHSLRRLLGPPWAHALTSFCRSPGEYCNVRRISTSRAGPNPAPHVGLLLPGDRQPWLP